MTTAVAICNLALGHIGKADINDLGEATAEAIACNKWYDHARRTLLQSSSWTFAKKRETLARVTSDFTERWAYQYTRPIDALSILRVYHGYAPRAGLPTPPFEVSERLIFTNLLDAKAEYIYDLETVTRFSPLFTDALAYHLAAFLARNLTRSEKLVREMKDAARESKSYAVTADAAQDFETYTYGDNSENEDYNDARR